MVKFTLILWVCSFLAGTKCMTPIPYPGVYDSWIECSKADQLESIKLLETLDPDFINENQVGMKYTCRRGMVY